MPSPEEDTKRIQVSLDNVRRSKQLLREYNKKKEPERAKQQKNEEERLERVSGSLNRLKTFISDARVQLGQKALRDARKQEKQQVLLDKEKEQILAEGGNPYLVWRRRELEQKSKEAEERIRQNIEMERVRIEQEVEQEFKHNTDLMTKKQHALDERRKFFEQSGNTERFRLIEQFLSDRNDGYQKQSSTSSNYAKSVKSVHSDEEVVENPKGFVVDEVEEEDFAKVSHLGHWAETEEPVAKRVTGIIKTQNEETLNAEKDTHNWSCEPILFKDFAVEEQMSQSIVVTNFSPHRSSCRLRLSSEEFLTLQWSPIGWISPGMSIEARVIFAPKLNTDLQETLFIDYPGGCREIPISCVTKKHTVQIPTELDCGVVRHGDETSAVMIIENKGALNVECVLESTPEVASSLLKLGPYEKKQMRISIKPLLPKKFSQILTCVVKSKETTTKHDVLVQFVASDLPVCLSLPSVMKTAQHEVAINPDVCHPELVVPCFENVVDIETGDNSTYNIGIVRPGACYQVPIKLTNTSIVAKMVEFELPSTLRTKAAAVRGLDKALVFSPQSQFVQAKKEIEVLVKLTVTDAFDTLVDENGRFSFPCALKIRNEITQIEFAISGTFSRLNLVFGPDEINLPPICAGASYSTVLNIKNPNPVAQEVLVYENASNIQCQPCTPFVISAFGERNVGVTIFGDQIGSHRDKLVVRSLLGTEYIIPIAYSIIASPIILSSYSVDFGSCFDGEYCEDQIIVRSKSRNPRLCHITVPNGPFKISPSVFEVSKEREVYLTVTYDASLTDKIEEMKAFTRPDTGLEKEEETEKPPVDKKKGKKGKKKPKSRSNSRAPSRPTSAIEEPEPKVEETRKRGYSDLVYVRDCGTDELDFEQRSRLTNTIALLCIDGVTTPIIVTLSGTVIPSIAVMEPSILDFGSLPVGNRVVESIKIINLSDRHRDVALLSVPNVTTRAPFEVINARRPAGPKSIIQLFVSFSPKFSGKFTDNVDIQFGPQRLSLPIKGIGAEPQLSFDVDYDKPFHLGDTLPEVVVDREINVSSKSDFPVEVSVRYESDSTAPLDDSVPIAVGPMYMTLQPGESSAVVATLRSVIPGNFSGIIYMSVGSQVFKFPVFGRVHPHAAFLVHPSLQTRADMFGYKLLPLVLSFDADKTEETFYVGNCGTSNIDFTIDGVTAPFSVSVPKSGVPTGSSKDIVVTFDIDKAEEGCYSECSATITLTGHTRPLSLILRGRKDMKD
ncbi:hypothetical protein PCE1_003147 [Barthelona sp. PCE]